LWGISSGLVSRPPEFAQGAESSNRRYANSKRKRYIFISKLNMKSAGHGIVPFGSGALL